MSSPVALMCGAAVIMAALAFVTTDGDEEPPAAVPVAAPQKTARPQKPLATERKATVAPRRVEKVPRRESVYVSVFNNSNISGLAATTAERIGAVGWQVVGSDNWYGTIPASTVYYPPRLARAGHQLALDLGIRRTMRAVSPMRLDRLTVILTGPLVPAA